MEDGGNEDYPILDGWEVEGRPSSWNRPANNQPFPAYHSILQQQLNAAAIIQPAVPSIPSSDIQYPVISPFVATPTSIAQNYFRDLLSIKQRQQQHQREGGYTTLESDDIPDIPVSQSSYSMEYELFQYRTSQQPHSHQLLSTFLNDRPTYTGLMLPTLLQPEDSVTAASFKRRRVGEQMQKMEQIVETQLRHSNPIQIQNELECDVKLVQNEQESSKSAVNKARPKKRKLKKNATKVSEKGEKGHEPTEGIKEDSDISAGLSCDNQKQVTSKEDEGWCRNKKYVTKTKDGFECRICQKRFGRYNSVSYHVTIYHRNPPIRCGQQDCQFTTREARYVHFHRFYRHGIPLPPRIDTNSRSCGFCGHVSKSPAMLAKHVTQHVHEIQQTSTGKCICHQCGLQFDNTDVLIQHVLNHHSKPHSPSFRQHSPTPAVQFGKSRIRTMAAASRVVPSSSTEDSEENHQQSRPSIIDSTNSFSSFATGPKPVRLPPKRAQKKPEQDPRRTASQGDEYPDPLYSPIHGFCDQKYNEVANSDKMNRESVIVVRSRRETENGSILTSNISTAHKSSSR